MRPENCVKNYQSDRRMYANYVARNIKKLCKEVGPRPSGSDKELEAQEWLANDLRTSCDDVKIEEFSLAPHAFMSWVQIAVFAGVAGAALLFITRFLPALTLVFTAVASALLIISIFLVITEFLFYKEPIDLFMPKKKSHNVIAVRRPSGEVKKRIIFSGHADSAPEWRFTYWGGPKLVVPMIVLGIAGLLYTTAINIAALVQTLRGVDITAGSLFGILSLINICLVPIFLFELLFYSHKHPVEGANDNLTGCLCSMALPRFMQDNDIRFENTEIMVVLTGSEESGLRGAKAFVKEHKKELEDVETVFIALDTVRDYDFMSIYHKDMTGTVKNDAVVSKLLQDGGALAGYELPFKTVSLGSTDAAAITKGGMRATSFAAMDPAPARYYHTRLDTADNLDLKTIEAGVGIVLETAFLYDEKGLPE